jgi:hypothetical protein
MAKIVTSIDIDRPVGTVWEYMTDLRHAKDWSTEVVDSVYDGPLRLGATGIDTRKWGKKEVNWDWKVTGYDPPRLLRLTYGPPLNAVADFTFEGLTADRTKVSCTTTLRPSGWLRLISPIIAAEGRKADQKQFAKVKSILEASQD